MKEYLWYFIIYSFLGWVLEVAYCTVKNRKIVNRGFLNGPVCPIYGFGMLSILILLQTMNHDVTKANVVVLFFGGMILSTLIELIGGWLLMQIFHTRWWDYSMRKYKFHGYICLTFSLAWGLGTVIAVKLIHSISFSIVSIFTRSVLLTIVLALLYCVFIADTVITVLIVLGANKRLKELDEIQKNLKEISENMSERIGQEALNMDDRKNEFELKSYERYLDIVETSEDLIQASKSARESIVRMNEDRIKEYENRMEKIKNRIYKYKFFGFARMEKAFPNLHSNVYDSTRNILHKQKGK